MTESFFSFRKAGLIHTRTDTFLNQHNRPNYVERWYNRDGFNHTCRRCKEPTIATWQLAVLDHLQQPNGSFYYCDAHCPENFGINSD
jgi:hypothetical protein